MEPIFGLAQPRRLEPDGLDDSLIATTVCRANDTCTPSIEYEPAPIEDDHTPDHSVAPDASDIDTDVPLPDTTRAPPDAVLRISTSSTSVSVGTAFVNSSNDADERHT